MSRPSSSERITCRAPRQWLYLFGDEGGIVYSEAHNRFAGLDPAGVAAYLAFETDDRHAHPITNAATEPIQSLAQGIFPAAELQPKWPALMPHIIPGTNNVLLEIGGISASLQFPSGALENLCRDVFRSCQPTTRPPQCHIAAQHTGRGWSIFLNGQSWMPIEKEEQLGLGFLHTARAALYQLGSYSIAFHAAMVAEGNCGILLCAPRESGKSTLTAWLAANGFDFLTDEPALLQLVENSTVHPIPLPISLKQGSWQHLQQQWPQLNSAPVHMRSDGTLIRLLHPPQSQISPQPRSITHLIFPRYSPSSPEPPSQLSPLSALAMLNAGGMLFSPSTTRDSFEAFLRMLCQTPAFALPFSSLPDAIQKLRAMCNG